MRAATATACRRFTTGSRRGETVRQNTDIQPSMGLPLRVRLSLWLATRSFEPSLPLTLFTLVMIAALLLGGLWAWKGPG